MYLTRVKLNTTKKGTVRLLGSQLIAHGAIETIFGKQGHDRKLWRLDNFKGQPCILLLSKQKPDLRGFIEQFGFNDTPWEIRDYEPLLNRLQKGQKYHFRLAAYPSHSVKPNGEQGRGHVVPHVTVDYQKKWLAERSEKHGFSLLQFDIVARSIKRFFHYKQQVSFTMVVFEGVIEITDAESFRSTLVQGIGREKAFGCGLLTIAP